MQHRQLERASTQEERRRAARASSSGTSSPSLTPLAVDPGHPFPYISNLSLNLAVSVVDRGPGSPPLRPRQGPAAAAALRPARRRARFVRLEHVIAANLDRLFPRHGRRRATTPSGSPATPTSLLEEGEADDLLAAVEVELRRRRFGRAVRLEVEPLMPAEMPRPAARGARARRRTTSTSPPPRSTSASCGRSSRHRPPGSARAAVGAA